MRTHLMEKRLFVLATLEGWRRRGSVALRERLDPVLEEIRLEYEKHLSPDELEVGGCVEDEFPGSLQCACRVFDLFVWRCDFFF